MIKITKSEPVSNFIQEIKHLREYTHKRYGVACELKQAKDIMDHILAEQETSPVLAVLSIAESMERWEIESVMERLRDEITERYGS